MLSRLGMSLRPLPAGPMDALEGPQMLGPVDVPYALAVADVDPYALADDVLRPAPGVGLVRWRRPPRPRHRADRRRRRGVVGPPECRCARGAGVQPDGPDDDGRDCPGRSGWLVDLRGRPVAPFEGAFPLRPHGIATARLDAG